MARPSWNRQVRQEQLREQLAGQKHVEHVVALLEKIENKDNAGMLAAYKLSIDTRLKLIAKYLPDVKAEEPASEGGRDGNADLLKEIVEALPD